MKPSLKPYAERLAGRIVPLAALLLAACATPGPQTGAPAGDTGRAGAAPEAPVNPEVKRDFDAALTALKAGHTREAEGALVAMTRRHPELSGPYANLGLLYYRTDRLDAAVEALDQATRLNPGRAAYYNQLGIIHRSAGRFDQAHKSYARALALDGNYAYAHLNIGILYDLYLGDIEKAMHHYRRYQQLVPSEADTVAKWIIDLQRRARASSQAKGRENG